MPADIILSFSGDYIDWLIMHRAKPACMPQYRCCTGPALAIIGSAWLEARCSVCRYTGRALFCQKLLSREGNVIELPLYLMRRGTDELIEMLLPKLETASAGNLDAYCR